MSDDLRVVRPVGTLADGRMPAVGDVVPYDSLIDPDTNEIAPHDQALIDDERLLPIEPAKPPTLEQLRERAGELEVEGRSSMNRDQLDKAVSKAEADLAAQTTADPDEEGV